MSLWAIVVHPGAHCSIRFYFICLSTACLNSGLVQRESVRGYGWHVCSRLLLSVNCDRPYHNLSVSHARFFFFRFSLLLDYGYELPIHPLIRKSVTHAEFLPPFFLFWTELTRLLTSP